MNFQFETLAELWSMAGHGPYVWGSYAVTAVTLVYLVVAPVLRHRRFLRQYAQALRRQQRPGQGREEQEPLRQ